MDESPSRRLEATDLIESAVLESIMVFAPHLSEN